MHDPVSWGQVEVRGLPVLWVRTVCVCAGSRGYLPRSFWCTNASRRRGTQVLMGAMGVVVPGCVAGILSVGAHVSSVWHGASVVIHINLAKHKAVEL